MIKANSKALVVDDELGIWGIIGKALELIGFKNENIIFTRTGQGALDVIARTEIDLIISDIERAGDPISSEKILEALTKVGKNIIFIFFSGGNEAMVSDIAKKYDVDGCIFKPCSLNKIIHKLETIIACKNRQMAA